MNVRILEVRPHVDFADWLADFDLISVSAGPRGELYALAVTAPDDYREVAPSGAIFPKVWTERLHDTRILRFDSQDMTRFDIPDQHRNFSFVQPLPNDELLLVVSRSRHFSNDEYDLNASVFTPDGRLQRQFLLGDGLKNVQTTADGRIWTSYFDEGIFGNFGWDEPIGRPGLILWDSTGNQLYQYSAPVQIGTYRGMTDCYALNVVSDAEVWFYYLDRSPASRFMLIRRQHDQVNMMGVCRITGSKGIAIWQNYVLFCGRYWQHEAFNLFEFSGAGRMIHRLRFYLVDEKGVVLQAHRVSARGSIVFLRQDARYYRVDIRDLTYLL